MGSIIGKTVYCKIINDIDSAIGEFLRRCGSVLGEDACARLFDIDDIGTFALLDVSYVR